MKIRYEIELSFEGHNPSRINNIMFDAVELAFKDTDINFEMTRLTPLYSPHSLECYQSLEDSTNGE